MKPCYRLVAFLVWTLGGIQLTQAYSLEDWASPPEDFLQVLRSYLPQDILFLHLDLPHMAVLELDGGRLLGISQLGRIDFV